MQTVSSVVEQPFIVHKRLSFGRELRSVGSQLSMDGMRLDVPGTMVEDSPFMWLEFSPTEGEEQIRALGEVVERSPFGVRVRFKHLFPDQKRRLAILLDEQAACH